MDFKYVQSSMKYPLKTPLSALLLSLTACGSPPGGEPTRVPKGLKFESRYQIYSLEHASAEAARASLAKFLDDSGLGARLSQGTAYSGFEFWIDEEANTVLFIAPEGKEGVIKSILQQLDDAAAG